ncbi:MAG: hypothetical protein N2999_02100 [Proteobacteria bacterium]|nr:hypothetical protein [Pseudomonadota bacterium]
MKFIGYVFFYIFFIILESLSYFSSYFLIKFDILIPATIFSVTYGGISSVFFTVFFALLTGLSQGFVLININFALLVYLLVSLFKNTFHINSKPFLLIITTSMLFIKALLLFFLNSKDIKIDQNVFLYILIYALSGGVVSFYLIKLVNYLSFAVAKKI